MNLKVNARALVSDGLLVAGVAALAWAAYTLGGEAAGAIVLGLAAIGYGYRLGAAE